MPTDPRQQFINAVREFPKRKRALSIGDSWFQYPLRRYGDIQQKLATHYRSEIIFYDDSNAGRDAKQVPTEVQPRLNRFSAHMAQVEKKPFDLILISLGGNDVIGQDFPLHLKKKNSPADGTTFDWNKNIPPSVRSHIKLKPLSDTFGKILETYEGILTMRKQFAPKAHVVCHSYADVTPSNTPYRFIGYTEGPWLFKPMNDFGLTDEAEQREVARWLLESFENLLRQVAKGRSFVSVLKTRKELPIYKGWWDNEIHPLGKGFQHLVDTHWIPEIDARL